MEGIMEELNGMRINEMNDLQIMKMTVLKNMCPSLKLELGGAKFNPELEDESRELDQDLAQPCSDLLFDCSLNELNFNCSTIFKSFATGTINEVESGLRGHHT